MALLQCNARVSYDGTPLCYSQHTGAQLLTRQGPASLGQLLKLADMVPLEASGLRKPLGERETLRDTCSLAIYGGGAEAACTIVMHRQHSGVRAARLTWHIGGLKGGHAGVLAGT